MTRVGRSVLRLPRYTLRKCLKGGSLGYFFNVPNWARKMGCPMTNEALGTDYDRAVLRAEKILLPAFDSWRTGGEMPIPSASGSWSVLWTGCFTSTAKPGRKRLRKGSSR